MVIEESVIHFFPNGMRIGQVDAEFTNNKNRNVNLYSVNECISIRFLSGSVM